MSINAEGGDWNIELYDRIEPLETHWRTLEATGCCTLFQSYDWLSVWYEVTSRHGVAEPVIVAATRNGADAPAVILPLCRMRRRGYREIAFADILVSDFAGPLFSADALDGAGTMRALWTQILEALPDCDVVHLGKIAEMVGDRSNPMLDLPNLVRFPSDVWGTPLEPGCGAPSPAVPEAMLASTNKRRAALARKFTRTVTWNEDPAQLSPLFDELVQLRMQRAEQIGRGEILDQALWREFYATLVARKHTLIRPVITRLQVDGQTIASMMGVGYGHALHYILPSFLMKKWSRYTPGFQMILDAMEASSARGYAYFDFTIGNEPYKQAFGGRPTPLYETFIPMTLRGWLLYANWRLRFEVRRRPRLAAIARKLLMRPAAA